MKRANDPALPSDATSQPRRRRPYEPPAIEESSEFETLALACGLTGGRSCDQAGGPDAS